MTNPEFSLHHFGPVTDFDEKKQGIYIDLIAQNERESIKRGLSKSWTG
jgi:hypothetical protein